MCTLVSVVYHTVRKVEYNAKESILPQHSTVLHALQPVPVMASSHSLRLVLVAVECACAYYDYAPRYLVQVHKIDAFTGCTIPSHIEMDTIRVKTVYTP